MKMPGILKTLVAGAGLLSGTAAAQDAPLPPPILLPAAPTAVEPARDQPNVRSMFESVPPGKSPSVVAQAQKSQALKTELMKTLNASYPKDSPVYQSQHGEYIEAMIARGESPSLIKLEIRAACEFAAANKNGKDIEGKVIPAAKFTMIAMEHAKEPPHVSLREAYSLIRACPGGTVLSEIHRRLGSDSATHGPLISVEPKAAPKEPKLRWVLPPTPAEPQRPDSTLQTPLRLPKPDVLPRNSA